MGTQNYNLSPRQKAAIFIMSLPPELSTQVIRSFPPEEVQTLASEMSKVPNVPDEIKKSVIEEFLENPELNLGAVAGSPRAGEEPHGERRVMGTKRPMAFLMRSDPRQVLALLEKESPQAIALALSYLSRLNTVLVTRVLEEMEPPLQDEVARRLAEVGKVRPEVLKDYEQILEDHYYALMDRGFQDSNGRGALMEILNKSDRVTEEKILSGLARKNPKLAKDLKNQLCEFEDLVYLDRASVQQLLKATDVRDLVLALKGASPEIQRKIYDTVSPDRARAIQEDVESLKVADWEEVRQAQQQVRNNLRGLVIIGKIKLPSRGAKFG